MKKIKSVLGIILAVAMLLQVSPMVFAANDSVSVGTTVRLRKYNPSISNDNYTDDYQARSIEKNANDTFDFMASIDMTNVWNTFKKWNDQMKTIIGSIAPAGEKDAMLAQLKATEITGTFTINAEIDTDIHANSSDKAKLTEYTAFSWTSTGNSNIDENMYGFNSESKRHFIVTSKSYIEGDPHKLTITVKPWNVSENKKLTIGDLENAYSTGDEWGDLAFQARNCTVNGTYGDGAKTVSMTASGTTDSVFTYSDTSKYLHVTYNFNDADELTGGVDNPYSDKKNSASVGFPETAPSRPTGGGGTTRYTITFDVEGDTDVVSSITRSRNSNITLSDLKIPYKDGYTFDGWYFDKEMTEKIDAKFQLTENMTVYGLWVKKDIDGNTAGSKLNSGDHFAYVVGYPDGNVRPQQNISREEIGAIFFRLLADDYRMEILAKRNDFDDMTTERWSNTEISTMAKGGYIFGYEDGTFKPEQSITRAEFAAIASRFDEETPATATHSFSDISGHWAENDIARAVKRGWITGYEDGTFKPDQNITRAEAMTIINRMLNRFVNEKGLHKDAILWPDNDKNAWYYYAVEEATNSHDYVRQADGVYETWTKINPVRDWTEFE